MSLINPLKYTIVLNSKSPRRRQLLEQMGFTLKLVSTKVEETYPSTLEFEQIPMYLSKLKGQAYKGSLLDTEILLCSDTMVFLNEKPMGKPKDEQEASQMINLLSGKTHKVISACYLRHKDKEDCFFETTLVRFKQLTSEEIDYYVKTYKPMDKAGAYGIQEWIGMIGVEAIQGDFYNVMGLPTVSLFSHIKEIIDQ